MSILGVAEDGLRLYAGTKYLCHTNKLPLNLVNFQKKATFQGCPFLGGRGKKCYGGGAGGIHGYAGNFFSQANHISASI